jgi:hypothetical protein
MKHSFQLPLCQFEFEGKPLNSSLSSSSTPNFNGKPVAVKQRYNSDSTFNLHQALKACPTASRKKPKSDLRLSFDEYFAKNSDQREMSSPDTRDSVTEENSLFQIRNDDSVAKYLSEILSNEKEDEEDKQSLAESTNSHERALAKIQKLEQVLKAS